jgi:hypothetical protein
MAQAEERAMPGARKPRKREAVHARLSRELSRLNMPAPREGVQPLNPGFFRLEAIRANGIAKKKDEVGKKVKGS